MNLTDVNRRAYIKRSNKNIIIPWDDPYPNIVSTLNEKQQILLKSLNVLDAKGILIKTVNNFRIALTDYSIIISFFCFKESNAELARRRSTRVSSGSTTKSIKFQQEGEQNDEESSNRDSTSALSGILKSRSSTKLSSK
jgi:hypothetical protein